MHIGLSILVRENDKIVEGVVEVIYSEDLDIRLLDGTLVRRKWWEIKKLEIKIE